MALHPIAYDHHLDHAEVTDLLRAWADACPELVELSCAGRSHEGRELWLLTLTNRTTGPASSKPALLVDANVHANELTAAFAALHLVHRLLDGHGDDPRVTRLLDTRALYVLPRINPDGVEEVLRSGRYVRSSVRRYPDVEPGPGLHRGDVDGDGRALFMRYPDPDGPWQPHPDEPRLLVPRGPADVDGPFYRLLLEGEIVDFDGVSVPVAPPAEGLDLPTNLPADWGAAPRHPTGAGPFPGSEPEMQTLLRVATERPNIVGYVSCHTFGGLHLHPPLNDDDGMPAFDGMVFADLGRMAAARTGYRNMSMHDLKYEDGQRFRGGPFGWFYANLGIYAWITEFWNPQAAAGITDIHPSRWLLEHPHEHDLQLLHWSDQELDGRGFVDWYPFEHPQLGMVELGGWDLMNAWYNPPFDRIEREVAPHTEWVIDHLLASALLEIRSWTSEEIGDGTHRLRLVVVNSGWLPTYGSRRAVDRGVGGRIELELTLPVTARLLGGERHTDGGQLEGHVTARSSTTWWGHDEGTPNLAVHEWVVAAPHGTRVGVRACHPRAGTAVAELNL
ncbi:M14 family metallopeptidase [Egicoccus sp. AB-alg6-2]|uniref:M14 family metallopeptidase n=1 Tax=Egicoccus sp. AB-alg6-2 TaxID=3242692 RepID=UPI00359CF192